MSQLDTIYAAIAGRAVTVTINGVSRDVTGLTGTTLVEHVESAIMPTRLITPAVARGRGAMQQRWTPRTSASKGGVITVDWEIQDVLFLRGADAGLGLRDLAPILTQYMANYISDLGAITTSKWSVTGIDFPIVGTFEWPSGSGRFYDGVAVNLTIKEVI
jgi:hypothetical protein